MIEMKNNGNIQIGEQKKNNNVRRKIGELKRQIMVENKRIENINKGRKQTGEQKRKIMIRNKLEN